MSLSTSLLWRGLLAVAVGIVSVAWPNITVGAFVILFAVYAFIAAAMDTVRAFSSSRAGPVFGYLLLAILSVAAGIVALAWPNITALVLVIWVAAWAVVTGVIEVALAFRQVATAGDRAMWAITGLVSVALGIVLFIRPDIGALSLATVFGLSRHLLRHLRAGPVLPGPEGGLRRPPAGRLHRLTQHLRSRPPCPAGRPSFACLPPGAASP